MQKRRAHKQGLPLTDADIQQGPSVKSGASKTRKRRRSTRSSQSLLFVYSLVTGLVFGSMYLGVRFTRSSGTNRRIEEITDLSLPLSQYASLEYALKHSRLVGLYFAAAWCPMSTPVTEMIDQQLGDLLLPPPSSSPELPPPMERAPMSIVYVSSDRSVDDFLVYPRRKWISVPFESSERTALKKHFSVCAKPEVDELGIDRKFEIPTLLILDGETHGVITTNGAEDLMETYREDAFEHWMGLHDLVRAMEEKYGGEGHGSIANKKPRVDHALSISSLFA